VGVDGSVKGWQEDFYEAIGLGDLTKDNFKRMGGVDGVVSPFIAWFYYIDRHADFFAERKVYECW